MKLKYYFYPPEPSEHYYRVLAQVNRQSFWTDSFWQFMAELFQSTPTYLGHALRKITYRYALKKSGPRFTIHPYVLIKFPQRMEVGRDCVINPFTFINALQGLRFGNNVTISSNCAIISQVIQNERMIKLGYDVELHNKLGPIEIGDNSWLAWGCLIGPGVRIGKNCQIGANSIVLEDVPDNCFVAGNPAKIIKRIGDKPKKSV